MSTFKSLSDNPNICAIWVLASVVFSHSHRDFPSSWYMTDFFNCILDILSFIL